MKKPMEWHETGMGNHQGLIIDQDGKNIAVSYDKADARLIAAAPELLAALKVAADDLEEHGLFPNRVANMLKLIAKAEAAQ